MPNDPWPTADAITEADQRALQRYYGNSAGVSMIAESR